MLSIKDLDTNKPIQYKLNRMIDELKHRPLALRYLPDPILRKKAGHVRSFSTDLQDFANDMLDFMLRNDGIGLAAPQVGVLQRIVVAGSRKNPICLVNPEIEKVSETDKMLEGCLSLPGVEFEITRPIE
jgi:peptide deformylase